MPCSRSGAVSLPPMATQASIPTASLRTIRPLVAGLRARNVDLESALGSFVDLTTLEDPDARVPASAVHQLWRQAESLSNDAAFGLRTAGAIQPGSFDVLDYTCRNCPTVAAGLRHYARYTPLLHDQIRVSVTTAPDFGRLEHVLDDGSALPRQYAEFIIASLVVIVRQASGVEVVPRYVEFIHAEPEDASAHREFFGCPIRFGAQTNGFALGRVDFDRPLVRAQPGLLAVLERHAEHLLAESAKPESLVSQVRTAIIGHLRSGSVSATEVGRALGMSDRTLRRRLDADGTTYQQLLSQVRQELALRYLEEKHVSIDEVGLLLGFADRSTFVRAFRQWTGRTPAELRRESAA